MPRRLLAICFLIAIFGLFSASRAKADDVFTYQFEGNTFTWQLPGSPSIVSPDTFFAGSYFEIEDVPFSENGGADMQGTLDFYEAPNHGGGFQLFPVDSFNPILNAFGSQLYTGGEGSPTFTLGTFQLNDDGAGGPAGTLVISSTPEPSSLLLVGGGMLALLGFARKRILG
jgi:PEP-CTERM motif